jgi:hypothetical protein
MDAGSGEQPDVCCLLGYRKRESNEEKERDIKK